MPPHPTRSCRPPDAALERLEAIDADLDRQIAAKTAELGARAEGRRARELRGVGAAYEALRERGGTSGVGDRLGAGRTCGRPTAGVSGSTPAESVRGVG